MSQEKCSRSACENVASETYVPTTLDPKKWMAPKRLCAECRDIYAAMDSIVFEHGPGLKVTA